MKIIKWLVAVLILVFCAQVFMFVDRTSHSVSDTLYGVFPYVVPSFIILYLLFQDRKR